MAGWVKFFYFMLHNRSHHGWPSSSAARWRKLAWGVTELPENGVYDVISGYGRLAVVWSCIWNIRWWSLLPRLQMVEGVKKRKRNPLPLLFVRRRPQL